MQNILAATLSNNPSSGWMQQWQSGWNSTPSATGGPRDTGLILLVLVVVIAAAIIGGLRRMAREGDWPDDLRIPEFAQRAEGTASRGGRSCH